MSNMMARAGASQAGVRSLPGSVWNMASRMAGGEGTNRTAHMVNGGPNDALGL